MEMNLFEARKDAVSRFMQLCLEEKNLPQIIIPASNKHMFGMDTNIMYGKLDATKQFHHTVKAKPTYRISGRAVRRTDVIVEFFAKTSKLIRVDFDLSTGNAFITLNPIKKSLLSKKCDELKMALDTVMKTVITKPYTLSRPQ